MKKFIIVAVLAFLIALPVSAMTQKATLINKYNERVAVEVGSQEAQQYWILIILHLQ